MRMKKYIFPLRTADFIFKPRPDGSAGGSFCMRGISQREHEIAIAHVLSGRGIRKEAVDELIDWKRKNRNFDAVLLSDVMRISRGGSGEAVQNIFKLVMAGISIIVDRSAT